jgi:hypothetical protein
MATTKKSCSTYAFAALQNIQGRRQFDNLELLGSKYVIETLQFAALASENLVVPQWRCPWNEIPKQLMDIPDILVRDRKLAGDAPMDGPRKQPLMHGIPAMIKTLPIFVLARWSSVC